MSILRAFRNRNYRLFFVGQGFSLIGTWLTIVATSWLIYLLAPKDRPGQAAEVMGWAAFASQLPILLVGPFGGVLADRWNPRRLLIVTQALSMIQSALLAWLALTNLVSINLIVILSIFQGVVNAFDMPARQKLTVDMIEQREDLPNAIALNSAMFNGARLLGPAIAGSVIYHFGVAYCFMFDAFSFLAVIIALTAMSLGYVEKKKSGHSVAAEMVHGLEYAFSFQPVRVALIMATMVSLMTFAVNLLLPIFASKYVGDLAPVVVISGAPGSDQGARIFGFMQSASGSGAVLGGLYLASRKSVRGLGKVIGVAAMVLGGGVLGFGLAQHLGLALTCMFAWGFGMLLLFASLNTVLQTIITDDKRGRVMSLFGITIMGVAPIGNLLGGQLASRFGEVHTAIGCGAVTVLCGVIFLTRLPSLRKVVLPIYLNKGIVVGDDV